MDLSFVLSADWEQI